MLHKKEKSYIIGVCLGDGGLSKYQRTVRLRITCDEKYPELINHIGNKLKKIFPKNKISLINRKGCFDISIYSKELESLVGWDVDKGSKKKQQVCVPLWIKNNKKYTVECLRGLIQTDGSIYYDRKYLMINFTNTSENLTNDVFEMICNLGYIPQKRKVVEGVHIKYVVRLSKETDRFMKQVNLWKK